MNIYRLSSMAALILLVSITQKSLAQTDVEILPALSLSFLSPDISLTDVTPLNLASPVGETTSKTITVEGNNLTEGIVLSVEGADASQFSVYDSSLPLTTDSVANTTVVITYSPQNSAAHSADLKFTSTSSNADIVRSLSGNSLSATAANPKNKTLSVSAKDGKITFTAAANEMVQIYNTSGQRILSKKTKKGENSIYMPFTGMYIVDVNDRQAKIVL